MPSQLFFAHMVTRHSLNLSSATGMVCRLTSQYSTLLGVWKFLCTVLVRYNKQLSAVWVFHGCVSGRKNHNPCCVVQVREREELSFFDRIWEGNSSSEDIEYPNNNTAQMVTKPRNSSSFMLSSLRTLIYYISFLRWYIVHAMYKCPCSITL